MKNRETDEWLKQNEKATREFIRKWGHFVKHSPQLKPIIPPKYDIGFIVKNCNNQLLEILEPWCSNIYVDEGNVLTMIKNYIAKEQPKTSFDLLERVLPYDNEKQNHILVEIDGNNFTQQDFTLINQLSEIIQDNGGLGEFELGNLKIGIYNLTTFEKDLIFITNSNNEKN
tara:strand:- start:29 stop:541 length:513 start_codon:yes stop_codon:yes gene_type:complete